MSRETQGTSPGLLQRLATMEPMPGSSIKPTGHAFVNGSIPSYLKRWMQRWRYNDRRGAQTKQQRMSAEGRSARSTYALRNAKLCAVVPGLAAVGVSEYVSATESMAPSSSTEVAIASAWDCEAFSARGVSERVEGLMKARSEYASAVEYEIEASRGHWSEVADATSDEDDEKGESDEEVFARLKKAWGRFCKDWGVGREARRRFSTYKVVGVLVRAVW